MIEFGGALRRRCTLDRLDVGGRKIREPQHFTVSALEAPIFFDRDQHSSVPPIAGHDDSLPESLVLVLAEVLLELRRGYTYHLHLPHLPYNSYIIGHP